jgi:serine/threonine-protein kinase PpkA
MEAVPEIPGYRILDQIGKGNMAIVFLAVQENLDRKVALKVMKPALVRDHSLCQRFLKEGKFIARMSSHPDLVTIYDISCHNDNYYMAMEYIPGGSLKERIAEGEGVEQPLAVVREVSNALKYAHQSGIIHRDVKPGNILFRDDGTAVLTDFGIAKAEDSETQFTRTGFTVGSPSYMSLEQRIGEHLDARSDLYSLGIVLYEMLTGAKPFAGTSSDAIGFAQKDGAVPRLPEVHSSYQVFIDRLLAKNLEERFPDAQTLIEAVDAYNAGKIEAIDTRRESTRKQGKTGLSGFWQWGAALFFLLGLASLIWYSFPEDSVQPDSTGGAEPAVSGAERQKGLSVSVEKRKVARLLEVASAHMAVGRLTEPAGANAREAYTMVLEIDPGNEAAKRGLSHIERLTGETRD